MVPQVGSLERSVEFHEQATLELERQSVLDKLETRVEEMEQLKVQLEQLSDLVKGAPLVVGPGDAVGKASHEPGAVEP